MLKDTASGRLSVDPAKQKRNSYELKKSGHSDFWWFYKSVHHEVVYGLNKLGPAGIKAKTPALVSEAERRRVTSESEPLFTAAGAYIQV